MLETGCGVGGCEGLAGGGNLKAALWHWTTG